MTEYPTFRGGNQAMDGNKNRDEIVTNRDRDLNAIRAGLKLLPGVGEALDQLLFGKGEEARQRRLHSTLEEVVDKLKERGLNSEVEGNEDFATFFSAAAQPISRSTSEDKRQRFRDLLFNSMLIPSGDPGWEESMLCLELLQKVDSAGLYTLATLAQADRAEALLGLFEDGNVPQWLLVPKTDRTPRQRRGIPVDEVGTYRELKYDPVLIFKSIDSLKYETKLVSDRKFHVIRGNSETEVEFWSLTLLGRFLVKWAVADF
jgi:hypothetical protein